MKGMPGLHLWTVPVNGGKPIQLTPLAPPVEDRFPCWSPDGKTIAFLRWMDPSDWSTTKVCIVPAQGGQVREITANIDKVAISSIAWSPDGRLIAFYSRDGAVKVIPPEGGASRVIAQGALASWDQSLSWSPDGDRLAYVDKSWKVMTVPIDGRENPKTVDIDLENARFTQVVWSPDGSRFVFKAVTGDTATGLDYKLWLMEDFLRLVRTGK
jgi:Tol biopolymer transport system component